ncbi:MAG: NYN domain-containing protein [Rhabdochlamydiaceae bacterium]
MIYLIDGYNLLFQTQGRVKSLERQRIKCLDYLKPFSLDLSMIIVFDGAADLFQQTKRSHQQDLEIVYTSETESADDYIISFLDTVRTPQLYTVVSSDRHLLKQARDRKAHIKEVQDFFTFLDMRNKKKHRSSEKIQQESPYEIQRLRAIFEKNTLNGAVER